jgi:predicted PurR-regulated permease PerM
MAFLGGGLWQVGGVLLVFMVVQSLDSYFITPRIMGRRTGLHPVTIIFSLLFWSVVLGGFLGLLLGIPLSAFVVVLGRLLRSKYIRELV